MFSTHFSTLSNPLGVRELANRCHPASVLPLISAHICAVPIPLKKKKHRFYFTGDKILAD